MTHFRDVCASDLGRTVTDEAGDAVRIHPDPRGHQVGQQRLELVRAAVLSVDAPPRTEPETAQETARQR